MSMSLNVLQEELQSLAWDNLLCSFVHVPLSGFLPLSEKEKWVRHFAHRPAWVKHPLTVENHKTCPNPPCFPAESNMSFCYPIRTWSKLRRNRGVLPGRSGLNKPHQAASSGTCLRAPGACKSGCPGHGEIGYMLGMLRPVSLLFSAHFQSGYRLLQYAAVVLC